MRALLATVVALVLVSTATAQQKPDASVHKLRSVAAADVVEALNTFADQKKLAATAVAEPTSNSVVIAGDTAAHKQLADLLATLDKRPGEVMVQVTVLEAAAGFAEDIGLGADSQNAWVLTAREVRLVGAALRHAKGRGEVDILARPSLKVADKQTGKAEVHGIVVEVVPQIDGENMLLRAGAEVKHKGVVVQSAHASVSLTDGQTAVVRGERKVTDGAAREVYLILTAHRIAPSPK